MLVIDDHPQASRILVEHFSRRGWRLLVADTFNAALELATREQPRVILTEVTLSDARGPSFVRALKAAVEDDVHVIAVTNAPLELLPGASSFAMVFTKPANLDALTDYIDAALK